MAAPVIANTFVKGPRLIDGTTLNSTFAYPMLSTQDAITAGAGGTKTVAYQLTAYISRVSVAANSGDSLKLPGAERGRAVTVINDTANAIQVFSKNTALINGIAAATGVSQPAGTVVTYFAPVNNAWFTQGGIGVGNFSSLTTAGNLTFTTANKGIVLKQGANGKCGTVTLAAGAGTVSNTSIAITDSIILSLNTVGGTIASQPYVATITAATGFTIAGGGGSNTSIYNYVIISNAA